MKKSAPKVDVREFACKGTVLWVIFEELAKIA